MAIEMSSKETRKCVGKRVRSPSSHERKNEYQRLHFTILGHQRILQNLHVEKIPQRANAEKEISVRGMLEKRI